MDYHLDTNICVYALHRQNKLVLARMRAVDPEQLVISSLVAAELAVGAVRSARFESNRATLDRFMSKIRVEDWGTDAIWHYARHRDRLRIAGTPIGAIDLLLGAQALAADAIFVTNNTREFSRIDGLRLENWTVG